MSGTRDADENLIPPGLREFLVHRGDKGHPDINPGCHSVTCWKMGKSRLRWENRRLEGGGVRKGFLEEGTSKLSRCRWEVQEKQEGTDPEVGGSLTVVAVSVERLPPPRRVLGAHIS